jgi:DNA-binding transcriptional ArsR family regulator
MVIPIPPCSGTPRPSRRAVLSRTEPDQPTSKFVVLRTSGYSRGMPRRPDHPDVAGLDLARLLAALGDPARLRILAVLGDHAEHQREDFDVEVGPSTLSHHMRIMREAGLTRHRFEGTRCFVSLRDDTMRRFPGVLDGILRAVAGGGRG